MRRDRDNGDGAKAPFCLSFRRAGGKQLEWKTIDQLIAEESKTMVYKSMHEMAPPYLCDLFTKNSTSSTDLKLPKKISCNGQRCFSYRETKMWNDLPAKTKQASSLAVFKKLI